MLHIHYIYQEDSHTEYHNFAKKVCMCSYYLLYSDSNTYCALSIRTQLLTMASISDIGVPGSKEKVKKDHH